MKKTFLLFSYIICLTTVTFGQTLLLNENFDYGTTANSDMTLASSNWIRHSGTQGPTYLATSLTYTGYPSSNVGGAVSFTYGSSGTNDGDINRVTSSDVTATSTVYASFLLNLSAAKVYNGAGDYFFHLAPAIIGTTFRGRVFAMSNGSGFSFGLSKSSETAVYSSNILNFNQTYLVVLKYSFNTAATTDDEVTLYVYTSSVPTSESAATVDKIGTTGSGTTSDPTDIGAIAIREGTNTPTGTIDGIRISTNWGLTVTGTATGVEEKNNPIVPTAFSLSQNYPNPFNPSTVINYQVPQNSFVNISVFDILGNQVQTLVNEEKPAGSYELKFNASSMPSGVYFYKIQTGSFTQTKKMILMK
jgi:hypothetical protein